MTKNPFKLSRLRDIGWEQWDPIGLLGDGEAWEGTSFADEYDTYLLRAASMLRHGQSDQDVAAYLSSIETEHMGLSGIGSTSSSERCLPVVVALRRYVEDELPTGSTGEPKTVML